MDSIQPTILLATLLGLHSYVQAATLKIMGDGPMESIVLLGDNSDTSLFRDGPNKIKTKGDFEVAGKMTLGTIDDLEKVVLSLMARGTVGNPGDSCLDILTLRPGSPLF